MCGCVAAYERALALPGSQLVLLELSPERVHLIYSGLLRDIGYLSPNEWDILQAQYEVIRDSWPSRYIYVQASDEVVFARLRGRARKEDSTWNLVHASNLSARWSALVESDWLAGKNVLKLQSEIGIQEMADEAVEWLATV